MEEVRSILKECGELVVQAACTVPNRLHTAHSDGDSAPAGDIAGGEIKEATVKPESMDIHKKEKSELKNVKVGVLIVCFVVASRAYTLC